MLVTPRISRVQKSFKKVVYFLFVQQTRGQSMIEFRRIQVEDGGVYTCEAWNSAEDQDGNLIVKRLNKTINVECELLHYTRLAYDS